MRVCLVSQEYPPGYVGGIGTQTRSKARGLQALGADVEILTTGDRHGPALATRDDCGLPVHELRPPGGAFELHTTEGYWLGYSWAVLEALRRLGAERRYDVIDFPDYGAEGFAHQLDRAAEDPTATVVHLHGSLAMFSSQIGWPPPEDPLLRAGMFMEDAAIAAADGVLAASEGIAQLTGRRLGLDPSRIDVVAGAVDTEVFCPPTGAPRRAAPRLLFVGNLVENKGFTTVLDAFIRLSEAHPTLLLAIAGSAEREVTERLSARAAQAGVADRIELLGFVEHEDLPALYRSADVFAAPSRYEGGLGLVYLEAMACGLPVIARRAGGAAEAVLDGETGLLLVHGDVEETAAAIDTLLVDAALRARMGAAARVHVTSNFTQEQYARRVRRGYERALERRRGSLEAAAA
jgi:glycosyltransferase involved in cell wall biosynthesis